MNNKQQILSALPSVDELLRQDPIKELIASYPRSLVADGIRAYLAEYRDSMLQREEGDWPCLPSQDFWEKQLVDYLHQKCRSRLVKVINGTGIILHTNLGRAVLSPKVKESIWSISGHYSNLEYELDSGSRGFRYSHVEELLCRLTGAEAAMAVNNNAAAVLLVLSTLARGREVVLSRGQLVEIGGSFRIPDVMAQSGVLLREVGSTNKTRLADYEKAIGENTAALMKVHTSNYRILGFTEETETPELVQLGAQHQLPVIEDLGSGVLVDLQKYGLPYEPTVQDAVKAGLDVVTFSGDKMLGGPQAGMIVGKRCHIVQMRNNPLARALRIDKLTLAALEATLRLYLEEETALKEIPVLQMLTVSQEELRRKAELLCTKLKAKIGSRCNIEIVEGFSEVGGGAMPLHQLPAKNLAIWKEGVSAHRLEVLLRTGENPVICRVHKDKLLFDVRTIFEEEFELLAEALAAAVGS
jgi:L-seryl-tRNA(Ser) seleniumtransferase